MPSDNSKDSQEMREQTARHILETGKSATGMAEELGLREAVRCRRKKAEERRNRRIREEREDILAVKEVFEENHRIHGCRRKRLHSTLGCMSPVACRLQHCRAGTA